MLSYTCDYLIQFSVIKILYFLLLISKKNSQFHFPNLFSTVTCVSIIVILQRPCHFSIYTDAGRRMLYF